MLSPEFFALLPHFQKDVAAVDLRVKQASYENELSRYRYDVVIHKSPKQTISLRQAKTFAWGQEIQDLRLPGKLCLPAGLCGSTPSRCSQLAPVC